MVCFPRLHTTRRLGLTSWASDMAIVYPPGCWMHHEPTIVKPDVVGRHTRVIESCRSASGPCQPQWHYDFLKPATMHFDEFLHD